MFSDTKIYIHKKTMLLHLVILSFCFILWYGLALAPTAHADSGWLAVYWNNPGLEGEPALLRPEYDDNHNPDININWHFDSPDPSVVRDYFSARWTRTEYMEPGRYRFTATADDGVRVWVNGQLLINAWYNQPMTTYTAYIDLEAGTVPIKVEYYDNQHQALIQVSWHYVTGSDVFVAGPNWEPTITGWRGEYYNNMLFAGPPNLVRNDPAINFDWGLDSPAPQTIYDDRFAVRWTNTLNLPAGRYRFTTTSDDGVRLWVNDRLVIDQWHAQTSLTHTTADLMLSGPVSIKMEYYDEIGLAEARLTWEAVDGMTTAVAAQSPPSSLPSASAPGPDTVPVATIINANVLNVRAGPGMSYDPFTYLQGGDSITLIGRDNTISWLQVRLADGRIGWIANGYAASTYPLISLPVTIPTGVQ